MVRVCWCLIWSCTWRPSWIYGQGLDPLLLWDGRVFLEFSSLLPFLFNKLPSRSHTCVYFHYGMKKGIEKGQIRIRQISSQCSAERNDLKTVKHLQSKNKMKKYELNINTQQRGLRDLERRIRVYTFRWTVPLKTNRGRWWESLTFQWWSLTPRSWRVTQIKDPTENKAMSC